MPRFRKNQIVVEAEQYTGPSDVPRHETPPAVPACVVWMGRVDADTPWYPAIRTLEGVMRVSPGDWIITGIKGEHYPCKPDIFEATYTLEETPRMDYRLLLKKWAKRVFEEEGYDYLHSDEEEWPDFTPDEVRELRAIFAEVGVRVVYEDKGGDE